MAAADIIDAPAPEGHGIDCYRTSARIGSACILRCGGGRSRSTFYRYRAAVYRQILRGMSQWIPARRAVRPQGLHEPRGGGPRLSALEPGARQARGRADAAEGSAAAPGG